MKAATKPIDLTPITRVHKGRTIKFYSPQQIEAMIPPEQRMPSTKQSTFNIAHTTTNGLRVARIST